MAFSLVASVSDVSVTLTDGNPFWLDNAEGLSSSAVVRHEQRGPTQQGATDLGYRLAPRLVVLDLHFYATTDAILDGYRDTLMSIFKPLENISIFLTLTRDDGAVRRLTCYAVDEIDIALVPEHRPGHLHRARVTLRAANPLWQENDVVADSANYATEDEWWLAGGAISAADILTHVEYPDPTQYMLHTAQTGDWAVAVVTAKETSTLGTGDRYVWSDFGSAGFYEMGTSDRYAFNNNNNSGLGYAWPGPTTENYHVIENRFNSIWWVGTAGTALPYIENGSDHDLSDGGRWGYKNSSPLWTPAIRRGMVFKNSTSAQIRALASYMLANTLGTAPPPKTVTLVNDGDVAAYPVITLQGPLGNGVITNSTTGHVIDLSGMTLTENDIVTIDLRTGDKNISDRAGSNMMGSITAVPIGLSDFVVAAAPVAAGGTNLIVLTAGSVGATTTLHVEFVKQYVSY